MELRRWWSATERRVVRHLTAIVGLVAVAIASLVFAFFLDFADSWSCSLGFDTDTVPPPADASPQGLLCGEDATSKGMWIWNGTFLLSIVLTVVLVAVAWRRWSWRAGIPALALIVVLPLSASWLLNRPSDDCTASARATNPAWACLRGG
jgi:4-amino-4-deoxy-L-arabinose transferase-like glycosyltransferase